MLLDYHQWQQEVLLLSRLVLPTERPGNTQHAGMVVLLQSSLVLEYTTQNNAEI